MDVKIAVFPETKLAVLEHRGPPEQVNNSVMTFIEWRKERAIPGEDQQDHGAGL
jgi:AraC family transcriptional regulator